MGNVGARALPSQVMLSVLVTALVVFSAVLYSCSRDDPPTGPGPVKDYPVYFIDGDDLNRLCRYYPVENRLDTVVLPFEIRWDYELSPDGDMLYVCALDNVYIVALSDTPHVVDYIAKRCAGGVAISNDGSLLALSGDNLEIVRTSDHSLVFSDTNRTSQGVFSHDDKTFYAVGRVDVEGYDPYPALYRVSLTDTTDIRKTAFLDNPYPRGPRQIVPFRDDRMLAVYFESWYVGHSFEIYDQTEGDVVFSDIFLPGYGSITLDPIGRYAYYTNPGRIIEGATPPSEFYRFNVELMTRDKTISTSGAFEDPAFYWWPVGDVVATPDGRWLILTHWSYDELVVYDLCRSEFSHFYRLDRPVILQWPKCQRNP
jgi:hypothetical protein